jgi:hypothetical protein
MHNPIAPAAWLEFMNSAPADNSKAKTFRHLHAR